MTLPVTNRQTRRRAKTRDALIGAAERLFALHGIDGISIDEIVAAADVAKGTFYNHFTDKQQIAAAIADSLRGEIEDGIDAFNAGIDDAAMRMARAVTYYARFAMQNPERSRAMIRLMAGTVDPKAPLNKGLRTDVAAGLVDERFTGTTREAAVVFTIGVAQMVFIRATQGSKAAVVEMCRAQVALMLRGLGVRGAEAEALAGRAADAVFNNRVEATP